MKSFSNHAENTAARPDSTDKGLAVSSISGNWRAGGTVARQQRSRSHARGSSLANLIPLEGGASNLSRKSNQNNHNTPAVSKTSGSRVSRVIGSCEPYSGDFTPSSQSSNGNELHIIAQDMGGAVPVNNRALALKQCEAPVRMGSRQVSVTDDVAVKTSTNRSVGPVADGPTTDDGESTTDDRPASMGVASLRVLVQALVQQGKTQYLVIRNSLQRPEYFGRALTREEKQTISDMLQDIMNQKEDKENKASQENLMHGGSGRGLRRQNSRARQYNKSKSSEAQCSHDLGRGLSRCNSNGLDRPPLARAPSRELRSQKSMADRLSLNERPTGSGHADRLSLTERLSTTDRLSLTMERLSLSKQYSNVSSIGSDLGEDADMVGAPAEVGEPDGYSLFADEPMRVSDCLAPVACP